MSSILNGLIKSMTRQPPQRILKRNSTLCIRLCTAWDVTDSTKIPQGSSEIRGKGGSLLRFYSHSDDGGHPGFCTPFCASVSGIYIDPLVDLE